MALNLAFPHGRITLKDRLAETKAWCLAHTDFDRPGTSLRNFSPDFDLLMSREDQVASIAHKREQQLKAENLDSTGLAAIETNGRFLLYFPDDNLSDGAANLSTNGFFNDQNCPPEDTWLGILDSKVKTYSNGEKYVEEMLVAWVPPVFVESVDDGIDVNPEQCIGWLDLIEPELAEAFARHNLVA